jgi:PAS domain S-box-containing protein
MKNKGQLISELEETRKRIAELETADGERKQAEEALRESEEKYRTLVEQSLQGLVVVQDSRIVFANTAFAETAGYTVEELLLLPPEKVKAMIHPEDQAFVWGRFRDRLTGKAVPPRYEYCGIRKDGTVRWLEMFASRIEYCGRPAIQGAIVDITDRKRLEHETKERRLYLESVLACAPDAIVTLNAQHNIMEWNPGAERLFGYTQEEVVGRNIDELITGADTDVFEEATGFTRRVLSGESVPPIETVRYRQDGSPVHVIVAGSPILLGNELVGVVAIYTDITERKQAEEELRRLKEFNESIVQSMAEGIVVEDAEGYFTFVNPAAAALLGYTPEELLGQHWTAVVPPDQQATAQAADERRARGEPDRYELELVRKDGEWISVLASGSPRFEGDRFIGTLAVFTDITEQKRAETASRQKAEDLALINALNHAINRGDSLQQIIDLLCRETERIFSSNGATVYLPSEDKQHLVMQNLPLPQAVVNRIERLIGIKIPRVRIPLKAGSWYLNALQADEPQLTHDPATIQRMMAECTENKTLQKLVPRIYRILNRVSVMSVPLVAEGEPVGLLDISRDEPFTESDLARFKTVAEQLTTLVKRWQVDDELKRVSRQNELILDSAGEGIYGLDVQGSTTFINPAAARMLGWEFEEIRDRLHHEIVHHSKPDGTPYPREECRIYATIRDGVVCRVTDEVFWRKDGTSFPVEYVSTPIREGRELVGAVLTFTDITERKQAEEALRQYAERLKTLRAIDRAILAAWSPEEIAQAALHHLRGLVPCLGAGVVVFDLEAQEAVLFAVDADREVGLGAGMRLPLEGIVQVEVLEQGEVLVEEDVMALSDPPAALQALQAAGVRSYVAVPLIAQGELIGTLAMGAEGPGAFAPEQVDITREVADQLAVAIQQAHLREDLQRHMENLEALVKERTLELQVALERAQGADRLKSEFVSNVSHELRSPLTNLKLYLTLLTRGRPDKRQTYLDTLHREADRLQDLIEGLLDLSRLDLGKTQANLQPTDLNLLVSTLASDRGVLVADRGLTLDVEPSQDLPLALADPKLLEQVLTNLLTNAMNYTPAGGTIYLCTEMIEADDRRWVTASVADTGPGISEKDQAHLFERFFRGEAGHASDAPGTGLGLAICKEIMDRHDGRITVESQVGQGSIFTVWLRMVEGDGRDA